jgi:pyruvate dehydrogenase E1 component beta subunit
MVFRGPTGSAGQLGAQHSQAFENWYANCPGLKVVVPSNPYDAKGLLKTAIRDNDPVVILENEMMYGVEFETTPEIMDKEFLIPIGKAKIERAGTDCTVTAHAKMVGHSLQAAEILQRDHDISIEVINLRSLRPLDRPAILKSIKKTHRIVNVEEGWPQCGIGAEIAGSIMESDAFDWLDAPMGRLTGAEVPMPYSWELEPHAVPQVNQIVQEVLKACYRKK